VAKSKYPKLDEKDALEKLRLDLYHPRDKLKDLTERILKEGGMSDSDGIKLFSLTKQLIEYENTQIQYSILHFYCDWMLSPKIDKSNTAFLMLSKITDVMLSDDGTKGVDIPLEVSKLLSIKKFRSQLLSLYASHNIPTKLFTHFDNWKGIMSLVLKEIVGKVIEFPSDVESREDYVGMIYKEMKQKATTPERVREMLIARKLWLSDNVEKMKKGDIYWFIQTKPNVVISGRLLLLEGDKDFTMN
jgi:hypothetical protein